MTIFRALPALLLVACTAADTPPVAGASIPLGRLVDLTHAFDSATVYWPTAPGFELEVDFAGETPGGWHYEANTFRSAEHGGTHLDAPNHFAAGQRSVDQVPLEQLIAPGVVIDITEAAAADRDYLVSREDFARWEAKHGPLPDGVIVLLRTGFASRWPDRVTYMGTDARGPEAVPLLHFPGLDPAAAEWLVAERRIAAIGIDTPSIDRGQSADFRAHRILFARDIPAFENVADMRELPAQGFHIVALPMKIAKGSGGPLRIVAILPN
jgi:kynurenine formamidase